MTRIVRRGTGTAQMDDALILIAVPKDAAVPWRNVVDYVTGSLLEPYLRCPGLAIEDYGVFPVLHKCRLDALFQLDDALARAVIVDEVVVDVATRRSFIERSWGTLERFLWQRRSAGNHRPVRAFSKGEAELLEILRRNGW